MRLIRRLAYWLRLPECHADLADEVAFHREMIEEDLIRRGMPPDQARHAARRAMGNETLMRESARHVWLWPSLEAVWQDARHAARGLRRSPIFTVGATLTLALGIGANTAMFSLVDRLLFRAPARMVDPASVHRVYRYRTMEGRESLTGGQYARYVDLARWATGFSESATYSLKSLAVGSGERTRLANVAVVSAGFFGFFDAPPALGRYFTAAEDAPPRPEPVAVLSGTAWRTWFGGRKDIVGSTVQIGAAVYTIIGVAPDGFVGLWPYRPPAAYIPVATYASTAGPPDWATTYSHAIGLEMIVRRKPGVTLAAANADLTTALRRSFQRQIEEDPGYPPLASLRPRAVAGSVLAERGPESSSVARAARWLGGVSIIVLLIACANVANLVLARTISRRREIAVRIALGVSRRRLLGLLLTEGLVLALLGGIAGVAVAVWASGVLRAAFLPGTDQPALITDWRTLRFAAAVALGAGLLAGLAPLAQLRRGSLAGDLRSRARDGAHQRSALRAGLVLLQSALSVVLLVGAGLFVQSLRNVRDVRLGFDPDSVLRVELDMRGVGLDSAAMVALRLRLLDAARSVPGVTHATLRESVPFDGATSWPLFVPGIDSVSAIGEFNFNAVSADYFATMGTRIVRGRGIASTDVEGAPRAAVVGRSMARVLWPDQDPIGQCMRVGADTAPCTYVVGIAEDIHSQSIQAEPGLFYYYLSTAQWQPQEGGLFVRAHHASRLVEPLRVRLQREMPGSSFVTVTPLAEVVDAEIRPWIVGATVFTAFGALALILAAAGLYSVMAYSVTQRRYELGVRLALGAGPARVVTLVVMQGVRAMLTGVAIGCAIAIAAGRWVGPMLFELRPSDPGVFGIVVGTMLMVAILASAIPALRAAGLDVRSVLQSD
ncbi:MAG TPA: ADOP family duplicated permease [Longimicrobium sp.]|jgi:predicted permease